MAKRKHYSRKTGGGMSGLVGKGSLMNGIVRPRGILEGIVLGAGASSLAEKVVPQVIPYQNVAIGFAVGGIGGGIGAYARDMLKGGSATGSNSVVLY